MFDISIKFEFVLILQTTQPHLLSCISPVPIYSWYHPHVHFVITNHGCRSKVCPDKDQPKAAGPKNTPVNTVPKIQIGPCYENRNTDVLGHFWNPDGTNPYERAVLLQPQSRCVPCVGAARVGAPRTCLPVGASCKKIYNAVPQVSDCGACSMCVPTPGSNGTFARCVNFW